MVEIKFKKTHYCKCGKELYFKGCRKIFESKEDAEKFEKDLELQQQICHICEKEKQHLSELRNLPTAIFENVLRRIRIAYFLEYKYDLKSAAKFLDLDHPFQRGHKHNKYLKYLLTRSKKEWVHSGGYGWEWFHIFSPTIIGFEGYWGRNSRFMCIFEKMTSFQKEDIDKLIKFLSAQKFPFKDSRGREYLSSDEKRREIFSFDLLFGDIETFIINVISPIYDQLRKKGVLY